MSEDFRMSPQLGDYMVTRTGGWVASVIRACTRSTVNHAAVYVGHGLVMEGRPHGAGLNSLNKYPDAIWSQADLPWMTRSAIVTAARGLRGTPYNYLDIATQAIVRVFGWNAPKWALARVSRPDRLQCAQLVDVAYKCGGVTLFPDGRPAGLVAPSDLLDLIKQQEALRG